MDPIKLFLCHSSKDKLFVRQLKNELAAFKHEVWLDENEIKVGESIFESVQEGLKSSDYVLIIISPNFVSSNWARRELSATFMNQMMDGKIRILPCLIQETELPYLLADIKYADFTKFFVNGLAAILETITPVERNTLDVYVNHSEVTIDLISEDGSLAEYTKSVKHIALIDGLDSFIDCLSVAGRVTYLKVKGAKIIRKWKESGFDFWQLKYPTVLRKGESLVLITKARFNRSFTNASEYWETNSNNHNADKFRVVIKFPVNRPPKKWYTQERIGTKYFDKGSDGVTMLIDDNRVHLIHEIDVPVNHTSYLLRWDW